MPFEIPEGSGHLFVWPYLRFPQIDRKTTAAPDISRRSKAARGSYGSPVFGMTGILMTCTIAAMDVTLSPFSSVTTHLYALPSASRGIFTKTSSALFVSGISFQSKLPLFCCCHWNLNAILIVYIRVYSTNNLVYYVFSYRMSY